MPFCMFNCRSKKCMFQLFVSVLVRFSVLSLIALMLERSLYSLYFDHPSKLSRCRQCSIYIIQYLAGICIVLALSLHSIVFLPAFLPWGFLWVPPLFEYFSIKHKIGAVVYQVCDFSKECRVSMLLREVLQ